MKPRHPLKGPTIKKFESLVRSLPEIARAFFMTRQSKKRLTRILQQIQGQPRITTDSHTTNICRGYKDTRWHKAYAHINGNQSPHYIPEEVFHCVVESHLNPFTRTPKYSDKNFYDVYFTGHTPTTIARIIRGRLLGPDYQPLDSLRLSANKEYVIKPTTETGLGISVEIHDGASISALVSQHLTTGGRDLIIQEILPQHEKLSAFNPSSLNTCRIMTLRTNNQVELVSSVFRCGRSGSRIDNHAAGGLACGIDRMGNLGDFAIDRDLNKYQTHPDSGVPFRGTIIPHFKEAVELVRRLHQRLPDIDIVSWDVAITKTGQPVVIETNIRSQEVSFHQFCNGPVFAPFADFLFKTCNGFTIAGIPMTSYWNIE